MDVFAEELSSVNEQLEAASLALSAVYSRYGIAEGEALVISAADREATAAIERMRSANARLAALLDRFPG